MVIVSVATPACDGDPADVAGDYSLALTKRDNGCNFDNWTEGDSDSNVPLVITQDSSNVTGTVGSVWGAFLQAWLGSKVYTGTVDGHDLEMTIVGTNPTTSGNCTYTFNSTIDATLDGDLLEGWVEYTAATNDNSDCSAIEDCVSRHQFNGTRPPQ